MQLMLPSAATQAYHKAVTDNLGSPHDKAEQDKAPTHTAACRVDTVYTSWACPARQAGKGSQISSHLQRSAGWPGSAQRPRACRCPRGTCRPG